MKHMILSFKMKGDVISDHFLMQWFQKDSLDTVGFRTFRTSGGGPQNVLNGQQYVIQMTKRPFWHLASDVLLLPLTLRREIRLVVDFFEVLVSINYQLVQIFVTDKQLFYQNGK